MTISDAVAIIYDTANVAIKFPDLAYPEIPDPNKFPEQPEGVLFGQPYVNEESTDLLRFGTRNIVTKARYPGVLRVIGLTYIDRYEEFRFFSTLVDAKKGWLEGVLEKPSRVYDTVEEVVDDKGMFHLVAALGTQFGFAKDNLFRGASSELAE